MNPKLLIYLVWLLPLQTLLAQDKAGANANTGRIYKCGNEYTNTAPDDQLKNCKLITGGNVTIVPAQRLLPKPNGTVRTDAAASRSDNSAQRERDNEARAILESELRKSEARLAELQKEYNAGEPEKRGDEGRNYQKYLDRTSELKASILRTESDIAGIRRELGRVPQ